MFGMEKSMSVKLLLADDHLILREGLKNVLEANENLIVVGEAEDGDCALKKIDEINPELVLLDIGMPKKDGIETLKQIKKNGFDVKVIILTARKEEKYIVEAYRNGCDGYVYKSESVEKLINAITIVMSGIKYITPEFYEVINRSKSKKIDEYSDKLGDLTRREIEVLKLMAEGMFNREIATKLNISERTVKNHISSVFKKIGVVDRTQAAVYAIKNGIVDIMENE